MFLSWNFQKQWMLVISFLLEVSLVLSRQATMLSLMSTSYIMTFIPGHQWLGVFLLDVKHQPCSDGALQDRWQIPPLAGIQSIKLFSDKTRTLSPCRNKYFPCRWCMGTKAAQWTNRHTMPESLHGARIQQIMVSEEKKESYCLYLKYIQVWFYLYCQ